MAHFHRLVVVAAGHHRAQPAFKEDELGGRHVGVDKPVAQRQIDALDKGRKSGKDLGRQGREKPVAE